MLRMSFAATLVSIMVLHLVPAQARGADPQTIKALYDRVSPSLVVVQYTWDSENGRVELNTSGIVVRDDGLIIISEAITYPTRTDQMADEQMKDFKIILPGDDETEIEAEFQGRDDRSSLAFVKPKPPKDSEQTRKWTPLKFEDVSMEVGDPTFSVGLLPKEAGYKTYMMTSTVAALLRGPVPQVLVSGDGLATAGSPVFNAQGQAIGFVHSQSNASPLLGAGGGGRGGRRGGGTDIAAVLSPPKAFVPARDFLVSLNDPPTAASPLKIPHLGVAQLAGLGKDLAKQFELQGQTAVQIGDVIPDFPADKAGLKRLDIIVKMNGQPLERGDEPDEASAILTRKIQRMKPGQTVSFSVLRDVGKPLEEVKVTLEERPRQPTQAKRFFAEDLGFTTREILFADIYERRLPSDTTGVIVALIKQNSSAQSGKLETRDLIVRLNQTPVQTLDQFKSQYEEFRKDHPRDAVVMEVRRGVNTQVVRIEPPQ